MRCDATRRAGLDETRSRRVPPDWKKIVESALWWWSVRGEPLGATDPALPDNASNHVPYHIPSGAPFTTPLFITTGSELRVKHCCRCFCLSSAWPLEDPVANPLLSAESHGYLHRGQVGG